MCVLGSFISSYPTCQSQVGYEEMKLPRTHIVYQSQVGYEEMKLPRTHIVYQSQVGYEEMKLPRTYMFHLLISHL
jgi:hypothetical protein